MIHFEPKQENQNEVHQSSLRIVHLLLRRGATDGLLRCLRRPPLRGDDVPLCSSCTVFLPVAPRLAAVAAVVVVEDVRHGLHVVDALHVLEHALVDVVQDGVDLQVHQAQPLVEELEMGQVQVPVPRHDRRRPVGHH